MRKTSIVLTVLGLSLASLFTAISTAPAQSDTKGKVLLQSKSVAVGIGVSWGDGILEYPRQGISVHDRRAQRRGPRRCEGHRYRRGRRTSRSSKTSMETTSSRRPGRARAAGRARPRWKNQNGVEWR